MDAKNYLHTKKKPYKMIIDKSGSMISGESLSKYEEIKLKNEIRNKKLKSL